jgi:hypothetical protein
MIKEAFVDDYFGDPLRLSKAARFNACCHNGQHKLAKHLR